MADMTSEAVVRREAAARVAARLRAEREAAEAVAQRAEFEERKRVEAEVRADLEAEAERERRAEREAEREARERRRSAVREFFGGDCGFQVSRGVESDRTPVFPGAPASTHWTKGVKVDVKELTWRCPCCGSHGGALDAARLAGLSKKVAVARLRELGLSGEAE